MGAGGKEAATAAADAGAEASSAAAAARALPPGSLRLYLISDAAAAFERAIQGGWPPAVKDATVSAGEEDDDHVLDDAHFAAAYAPAAAMRCPVVMTCEMRAGEAEAFGPAICDAMADAVRRGARVAGLDFSGCGFLDEPFRALCDALCSGAAVDDLIFLRLRGNVLSSASFEAIARVLRAAKKLVEIAVTDNFVLTDNSVRAIGPALAAHPSLRSVALSSFEPVRAGGALVCLLLELN